MSGPGEYGIGNRRAEYAETTSARREVLTAVEVATKDPDKGVRDAAELAITLRPK